MICTACLAYPPPEPNEMGFMVFGCLVVAIFFVAAGAMFLKAWKEMKK